MNDVNLNFDFVFDTEQQRITSYTFSIDNLKKLSELDDEKLKNIIKYFAENNDALSKEYIQSKKVDEAISCELNKEDSSN